MSCFHTCRAIKNWFRRKSQAKKETEANLYMRWEQDNSLEKLMQLSLFEEYLEMGQFSLVN
jgi:hypothetical protein